MGSDRGESFSLLRPRRKPPGGSRETAFGDVSIRGIALKARREVGSLCVCVKIRAPPKKGWSPFGCCLKQPNRGVPRHAGPCWKKREVKRSFSRLVSGTHLAVGQNQWDPGAPPIVEPSFTRDWDVYWGYGILTHGHVKRIALFIFHRSFSQAPIWV